MKKRSRDNDEADRDKALDDTLAATFPASDPLSTDPNPRRPDEDGRIANRNERGASDEKPDAQNRKERFRGRHRGI